MSVPTHIKEHAILGVKSNAATDHGGLSGLADDDHTQYLLANGTRALSGNWSVGADIIPSSNDTYHLGSSTVRFNAVYASSFMFGTTVMLNGGTTNMSTGLNLVPSTDGGKNLGASDQRFNTLYLSANLSDGTNTLTIANAKTAYDFSQDATLISIALLGTAADKMLYTTGIDTWAEASLTAAGRALLDDANTAAQIATLGLDADLATFSLPASTTISTFGASLIDDAAASNAIATLGLDADIATLSLPASTTITAAAATILDDVSVAAINTTLGLGTTDSPTFGGLSVTNAGADSTTTITGGTRVNLFLSNTNANAGARNWRIAAQYTNYGTLDFVVGTSQGAAPSVVAAYFDSSYNLNLASHKLYLNSTAYLDGATAGVVGIGAAGIAGATLSVGDVNASGLATPLALSMGGTYCTSAGQPGKCKIKVFDMGGTTTTYGFNVSDSLLEIHSASATAFYSAGTERFRVAATGAITSTKSVTHQIGNLQISDDATYCSLTRVA